jgi:hypothetical protein
MNKSNENDKINEQEIIIDNEVEDNVKDATVTELSKAIASLEKKNGRKLTETEIHKVKEIYAEVLLERENKTRRKFGFSTAVSQNKDSILQSLEKNETPKQRNRSSFKTLEEYLLKDGIRLMEIHKKEQENEVVDVQPGQRINLKYPGKVHLLARDRSGDAIEINNKADVEYHSMNFRKKVLDEEIKEESSKDFHENREFE